LAELAASLLKIKAVSGMVTCSMYHFLHLVVKGMTNERKLSDLHKVGYCKTSPIGHVHQLPTETTWKAAFRLVMCAALRGVVELGKLNFES
jgi:hypothetical protein